MVSLRERVKELLDKGLPEHEIISQLKKEGFKTEEIETSIGQELVERLYKEESVQKKEEVVEEKVSEKLEAGLKELEKYMKKEEIREPSLSVFIKVEKYGEIINTLERARNKIDVVEKNLNLLKESDKLRSEVLDSFKTALSALILEIINLDNLFEKPGGPIEEMIPKEGKEEELTKRFEEEVKSLRERLENLKKTMESSF
ncbi:MAG: hypothetical protein RMJ17_03370 [Candidatus Aenigmarchaeota archaeon]|nr:hypothetical protein [Candidatus Aenigmarchaeota archaeon]MDW8149606.1 hypothetical protein [Candidatus Aenigmarchaeota archaeon]